MQRVSEKTENTSSTKQNFYWDWTLTRSLQPKCPESSDHQRPDDDEKLVAEEQHRAGTSYRHLSNVAASEKKDLEGWKIHHETNMKSKSTLVDISVYFICSHIFSSRRVTPLTPLTPASFYQGAAKAFVFRGHSWRSSPRSSPKSGLQSFVWVLNCRAFLSSSTFTLGRAAKLAYHATK